MTNEARIEELERDLRLCKMALEEGPSSLLVRSLVAANSNAAAQADYAVKLREALEACEGKQHSEHCPILFEYPLHEDSCNCHVGIAMKALSLTPTEAMRQVKEKAWEEGVDFTMRKLMNAYQSNLPLNSESILAELRKKEGV